MPTPELSRRRQIKNLVTQYVEQGVPTEEFPSRKRFSRTPNFQPMSVYDAGEMERWALTGIISDPVIDLVLADDSFFESVTGKQLSQKCLGARALIFGMLQGLATDEFRNKVEIYAEVIKRLNKKKSQERVVQAYNRLSQWSKFIREMDKDNLTPIDKGPQEALQDGFHTAITITVGLMKMAYELGFEKGEDIFNPGEITNTFDNSLSTALKIAASDKKVLLGVQATEFIDSSNYSLENYGEGYRVAMSKEFEERLRSPYYLTKQQLEDPKGCPALQAPNGEIVVQRLYSLFSPVAENIYHYLFQPLNEQEKGNQLKREDMGEANNLLRLYAIPTPSLPVA